MAQSVPEWERVVTLLVDERGEALVRYATLLSGRPDEARDIVQDALVRTFGRLRNGFTVRSAEAYVRKAILHQVVDRGRRMQLFRAAAPREYRPDVVESRAGDVDLAIDLGHELDKLSPRERACVVLRYYEDLKVDDIASSLGISSGSVKRYLSDGLARMAIALADDGTVEDRLGTPARGGRRADRV